MDEYMNPALLELLKGGNAIQVIASLSSILAYFLVTRLVYPRIEAGVEQGKFKSDATIKAFRLVRFLTATVTVAALLIIWGFDFSGLLVVTTSIITVVGIALFASWSILSNVTAFLFLLVQRSFRRGNFIRVIDADNYIEGYIAEVNMLNTRLITEDREVVIYPNNLLLSRPTIINPRTHRGSIGKTTDLRLPAEDAPKD